MTVFDTLSQLESYQAVFPDIAWIITVMDRSLPYEEGPGRYEVNEKKDIVYHIDEALTSDKGFTAPHYAGKYVMEIVLDGDEIVCLPGSVFRLSEGRFLIYSGDDDVKRGVSFTLPSRFKAVRFVFTPQNHQ